MASSKSGPIPTVSIADHPAFTWRGMMLELARHMQPVDYVKRLIDRMAADKLNVLHWHLSDDQGWRIEIDRYPRLTSIGAWRQEAGAAGFDPRTGKPILYGGYYTKAQIRDVVAFAAQSSCDGDPGDRHAGARDGDHRRLSASSVRPAPAEDSKPRLRDAPQPAQP